jgi:hypothetical protein
MDALVQIVDCASKHFGANCLGWRGVINSANDLLTRCDLGRFTALCNDGYDAIEGKYYLYKNWQSSFLGCPTYIWFRNGVKDHKEVVVSVCVGSDNKSWGGSIESTGGCKYFLVYHQWIAYFEWLQFHPEEVARYCQFEVCAYASYFHCCVLFSG